MINTTIPYLTNAVLSKLSYNSIISIDSTTVNTNFPRRRTDF